MSRLFFRTHAAPNLSFPTSDRLGLVGAGIVMVFTLEKPKEDSMIEKLKI